MNSLFDVLINTMWSKKGLFGRTHKKVSMMALTQNISQATLPALSLSERLEHGDLMDADCPSREVLRHLTSRWGVLVLIALQPATLRFSELRRKVGGVSERMLAQTLQWLERDGMVDRKAYQIVPPHVEYTLTALGREAASKVRDLADWIEVSMPRIVQNWDAVQQQRP